MFLLPKSYWEIRTRIYQNSTGEKKNRGVFAKKDIAPGTIIGDYLGLVVPSEDEDKYEDDNEMYLMYYTEDATIAPDPKKPGVHILNHSCMPNCGMYTYMGHTVYFALRRIHKGEELTVSYQLSPKDKDCKPCTHQCYCSTPMCTKTMHLTKRQYDNWVAFEEKASAKTKIVPASLKTILPRLRKYPKRILPEDVYGMFGNTHKKSLILSEKTMPTVKDIHLLIQETGLTIYLPLIKKRVLGIHEGKIITA
ncbi:MAG: SET domain-containing protein [Candidatus Levybacteria bacterium]|nr:SET domain-containing protein [Candidatus Levybacteria bacterium]